MDGFGGMIAFELGSFQAARSFLNALRLMTLAESLGGVETLVCHPASMTHASVPPGDRRRLGLTDGLVRISAGIEEVEDLIEDVERGLAAIRYGEFPTPQKPFFQGKGKLRMNGVVVYFFFVVPTIPANAAS